MQKSVRAGVSEQVETPTAGNVRRDALKCFFHCVSGNCLKCSRRAQTRPATATGQRRQRVVFFSVSCVLKNLRSVIWFLVSIFATAKHAGFVISPHRRGRGSTSSRQLSRAIHVVSVVTHHSFPCGCCGSCFVARTNSSIPNLVSPAAVAIRSVIVFMFVFLSFAVLFLTCSNRNAVR